MLDFSSDHEKPTNAKIDCLKLHEPVKCSTFARAAALPPHALPWSGANGLSQPKDDAPRVPAAAKKKNALASSSVLHPKFTSEPALLLEIESRCSEQRKVSGATQTRSILIIARIVSASMLAS